MSSTNPRSVFRLAGFHRPLLQHIRHKQRRPGALVPGAVAVELPGGEDIRQRSDSAEALSVAV